MEFYESVQGYIATECPVCGTRLILRPEQAGSTLKCEMCYHRLAIPKEIRIRPKAKAVEHKPEPYAVREEQPPTEVSGPDPDLASADALPRGRADEPVVSTPQGPRSRGYDLVPSDDPPPKIEREPAMTPRGESPRAAPVPAQEPSEPSPRRRKEAFAVVCPKCNNRMYARLHQVGEQIACGDCGYVMEVPRPPAERPTQVLPLPEPVAVSPEEPPERPYHDDLARATAIPAGSWQAEPPRWTFFSGVVRFLWQGAGPLYWSVLSGGLMVTSILGILMVSLSGGISGGYGGLGPAMMALFTLAAFAPIAAWTLSYGAACVWAVMHDTANGADEIVDWPQLGFSERLGELVRLVYHAGMALAIPYGAGLVAAQWLGPTAPPTFAALGVVLVFPFLSLSSLESNRTIWPFSAVVFRSLFSLWWGWVVVYLEIATLLAVWAATVVFTIESSPYLSMLWSSPILAAVALITARLLGRLIWRATVEDLDDQPRRETVYERVVRTKE
jgi:DNA-directed RNA polymerase subunit M/transcription elongation factor TFIIS